MITINSTRKQMPVLKDDYEHMQNMIFGEKIPFDIILKDIEKLEEEINIL